MHTIIIISALILCDGQAHPLKQMVQTTPQAFEHDVQLLRMGFWDHVNERRCKALKLKYVTTTSKEADYVFKQ